MPAVNINLLPIDLSAKSGVAKLAATLKKLSMALLIIFLVLGVMAGAFIIIFSLQIDTVNKSIADLKGRIATLEVTEQKTVLVKDRLGKIKVLISQGDIRSATDPLRDLVPSLPSGVVLSSADIDASGKTKFGFDVTDSSNLVAFLGNFIANTNYKNLIIKNFTFNPITGYQVSFEATLK